MANDNDSLEAMFAALDNSFDSRTQGEYLRPPCNFMGNKFGQLDFILPLLPWHKTYVEVFGGSGAVLLAKNPSKLEIFNDRFAGSVAFYKCLQDTTKLQRLKEKISLSIHAREFFAWCRDTWNKEEDDVERAFKWYYMIQASFAGRGEFFGRVKKTTNNIPNKIFEGLDLFPALHERLHKVQFENLDYKQCMQDFDGPETLFYLDPPYYGNDVYATGFTKKDHLEMCQRIFMVEGSVVLSGYENPIYDKFDWDSVHINDNVSNRVTAMAFDEHNNMQGLEGTTERGNRREYLWVKESN